MDEFAGKFRKPSICEAAHQENGQNILGIIHVSNRENVVYRHVGRDEPFSGCRVWKLLMSAGWCLFRPPSHPVRIFPDDQHNVSKRMILLD